MCARARVCNVPLNFMAIWGIVKFVFTVCFVETIRVGEALQCSYNLCNFATTVVDFFT